MAGGFGAGYLFGVSPSRQATTNSTMRSHIGESNQSVTGGLQLMVNVSSTSLHPGQALAINVTLFNTLPSVINLTVANRWKVEGYPIAIAPPCYVYPDGDGEPVEFMIVKGNHSISELQSMSVNSTVTAGGCGHESFFPMYFLIDSRSSSGTLAVYVPHYPRRYSVNVSLTAAFPVKGYWTYPINESEATDVLSQSYNCGNGLQIYCPYFAHPEVAPIPQQSFGQGVYTLVVSDEWGQVVCIVFTVT